MFDAGRAGSRQRKVGKPFNYRLAVLVSAFVFGLIFSLPSFLYDQDERSIFRNYPRISLGLDLRGGLSLLMSVDGDSAIKSRYSSIAANLSFDIKDKEIMSSYIKYDGSGVSFNVLDPDDEGKVDSILKGIRGVSVAKSSSRYSLSLSDDEKSRVVRDAIEQAVSTIRNRLDRFGLSEPNVSRHGSDKILVEVPGIKTTEEQNRIIALVSKSSKLELMAVDEDRIHLADSIGEEEAEKYGDVLLPYIDRIAGGKFLLKSVPIINGEMLVDANAVLDNESGQPVVNFTLNSVGSKIFADFSGNNIGKRMAIVLDGEVFSAPVIRSRIGGGSGQISGGFTMQQARDLSVTLKSGALPAPVEVIEKRSVGPSLGADSIEAAFVALISGFVMVVGFMIAYYSMAGVLASLALVVNLLLIIATMSIFGATLTLPGMAGIVLTVGMAVDANIIINERIRESLRSGGGVKKAIDVGYKNASRAIFDSNSTSLIASLLLYIYGNGAIRGFAITTSVGIVASVITAIVGTHGIYVALKDVIDRSGRTYFWFGIRLRGAT